MSSAGVLLIGHHDLAGLLASSASSVQPGLLRSRSQYLADASAWDAALREMESAARLPIDTEAALTRFTGQVEAAGLKLDRRHSWLVAQCLADAGLERWVRTNVRNEASVKALVSDLMRDPKVLDSIPEMAVLGRRLASLKAEKIAIVRQIIEKERAIAGAEAGSTSAARKAAEAEACEATWAIVTAILVIVSVVVSASTASVGSAANALLTTYKGTGADLSYSAAISATRSYRQCVSAAASLTPSRRASAIAACQLRWLEEMM